MQHTYHIIYMIGINFLTYLTKIGSKNYFEYGVRQMTVFIKSVGWTSGRIDGTHKGSLSDYGIIVHASIF